MVPVLSTLAPSISSGEPSQVMKGNACGGRTLSLRPLADVRDDGLARKARGRSLALLGNGDQITFEIPQRRLRSAIGAAAVHRLELAGLIEAERAALQRPRLSPRRRRERGRRDRNAHETTDSMHKIHPVEADRLP